MINKFISQLLPGNYSLTKSMELTKINSSGTLWYMKKFIVLYYFCFLTDEILTNEYISNVKRFFDNYINSLPEENKAEAEKFFYPEKESINFKSPNFKTFNKFIVSDGWKNALEKNLYIAKARKYYFALLMDAGGQTGVKKIVKNIFTKPAFVFSAKNIQNAIQQAAIESLCDNLNENAEIGDNSIQYLLPPAIVKGAKLIRKNRKINPQDVLRLSGWRTNFKPKYEQVVNDIVAFIRNERQILYYYGFFHSRSTGAKESEFSSLTPVGEASLGANFYEFLIIWEHQKIKMISQSPIVKINELENLGVKKPDFFSISFSPYLDILGCMLRREKISISDYKFIISRRNHNFKDDWWAENENKIFEHKDDIQNVVKSFGRKRDLKDEDARKELLKYLLGIRDDLKLDKQTNPIGCCVADQSGFAISNPDLFKLLFSFYQKLDRYKIYQYLPLFLQSELEIRKQYIASIKNNVYDVDKKRKINWDFYNIKIDKVILSSLFCFVSAICIGENLLEMKPNKVSRLFDKSKQLFPSLLNLLNVHSISSFKKWFDILQNALLQENFDLFDEKDEIKYDEIQMKKESSKSLLKKIIFISKTSIQSDAFDRKRYQNLINLLREYYYQNFAKNGKLRCECCGDETFIKDDGLPFAEFHHLIPFKKAFGPDHFVNLVALCPNCHRKFHFIQQSEKVKLYDNLNENNNFKINIIDRMKILKTDKVLKSYHLEYLVAEGALSEKQYDQIIG